MTIIYMVELLVVLFVRGRKFFRDGWCLVDLVCVLFSIVGIFTDSSAQVVRMVRILRVVRIFRRSSSLQRITSAIVQCLAPLSQTLILILVVNAIYAVVCTQMYKNICPGMFGTFTASALTLIQVFFFLIGTLCTDATSLVALLCGQMLPYISAGWNRRRLDDGHRAASAEFCKRR